MYSSLNCGMPVEFSHCEKNAVRFKGGWPFTGGGAFATATFSNSLMLADLPSYFVKKSRSRAVKASSPSWVRSMWNTSAPLFATTERYSFDNVFRRDACEIGAVSSYIKAPTAKSSRALCRPATPFDCSAYMASAYRDKPSVTHVSEAVAGSTRLPHHCSAANCESIRSLPLAYHWRAPISSRPGAEYPERVPSGICATV